MRISDWSSDVCSSDLGYKAYGERRVQRFSPADCISIFLFHWSRFGKRLFPYFAQGPASAMRARIMSEFQSDLLRLLETRGYIHQITDADGLDALAAKQIVPGYISFEPTAPSLPLGHLVSLIMLAPLPPHGPKPPLALA